ncbi:DUF983 domain-containing protein [Pelagibacterium montanilacus]|uniref:DUF983 domain-containing protein n=1 Tax=Pelagibacterium montanilacus TaxID=2185280 RepID=UPI000F8CB3B5
MKRGMLCRCPNCGEGRMFRAYLKVADSCEACGQELHHHRADDAPPYLVIFIVGHLIVGLMLHIEMAYRVAPLVYLATMIPLTIVLSLAMLPPIKGAVVALQWAKYMHGFDPAAPREGAAGVQLH